MDFKYILQELAFTHKDTKEWDKQMRLLSLNPILYLEEYTTLPEDICLWKQDEELHPAAAGSAWLPMEEKAGNFHGNRKAAAEKQNPFCPQAADTCAESPFGAKKNTLPIQEETYCVGIGTYKTAKDGEIYLCVLLDSQSRKVAAYSFGVYRSPELVGKALEIFFRLEDRYSCKISLLSSRNAIYQSETYARILSSYPVRARMTEKGSHGQAAVVSTYFSQLMRRKVKQNFSGWQDAVDWLTTDILRYNLSHTLQLK